NQTIHEIAMPDVDGKPSNITFTIAHNVTVTPEKVETKMLMIFDLHNFTACYDDGGTTRPWPSGSQYEFRLVYKVPLAACKTETCSDHTSDEWLLPNQVSGGVASWIVEGANVSSMALEKSYRKLENGAWTEGNASTSYTLPTEPLDWGAGAEFRHAFENCSTATQEIVLDPVFNVYADFKWGGSEILGTGDVPGIPLAALLGFGMLGIAAVARRSGITGRRRGR
ncbi:MAG: hypothetical protein ACTSU5_05380, partial [Promethearchaeota archaeon]